jgi:hypothetical protein
MPSLINPYIAKVCTGSPISTTSLGAYYKFNGNATDSSGNGLNATTFNIVTYVPGKYQTGINFNSTFLQYATVPDSAFLEGSGGNISVFFWINIRNAGHAISKESGSTGYRVFPRPGLDWLVTVGGVNISRGVGATNVWYHHGFTYNNSIVKIYENGVQLGADQNIGSVTLSNTETMNIGRQLSGISYLDGTMDEVNIWQRVLTPTEITNLYNSTCPLIA